MKVPLKELGAFERRLAKALPRAVERAAYEAARKALTVFRNRTADAPPASPNGKTGAVFTGAVRDGWGITRKHGEVSVTNKSTHAAFVEAGREPGSAQPPTSALEPWVRAKLGVAPNKARGVAFIIARAIALRGLKSRKIIERAMPRVLEIYDVVLRKYLARAERGA